jgi:pyruvate dehydrogenase E1 component alpha subunit
MKKNNLFSESTDVSYENTLVLSEDASALSLEKLLKAFQDMVLIRRFEERCADFYTQGRIRGFCHLCIGQEATPVALELARNSKIDSTITAYRCHGAILAGGGDPTAVMLELIGLEGGTSKGKGGSMHLFDPKHKFYGGHGIVGASTSLGTGLAFAHKYQRDGGICIAFLGDGASNQGQFFEAMNMAVLWGLPILYVIENNGYSMGTSVERGCANSSKLYTRGEAFGIPGSYCLGSDIQEVFHHFTANIEAVRSSKRPRILEVRTHRFKGHSMSDPGQYRSKTELEQAKKLHDPLNNLKHMLQTQHNVTNEWFKEVEQTIKSTLQSVLKTVESAPYPSVERLYEDIYMPCKV